jgi:hypothetical protein
MNLKLKIAILRTNREMGKLLRFVDLTYNGTIDTADLLSEFRGNAVGVRYKEVYNSEEFKKINLTHRDNGRFWYIMDNLTDTVYEFLDSKVPITGNNIETLENKLAVQFLDYLVSVGNTKEFKQYTKTN